MTIRAEAAFARRHLLPAAARPAKAGGAHFFPIEFN
jgi:hypothetical protein